MHEDHSMHVIGCNMHVTCTPFCIGCMLYAVHGGYQSYRSRLVKWLTFENDKTSSLEVKISLSLYSEGKLNSQPDKLYYNARRLCPHYTKSNNAHYDALIIRVASVHAECALE